MFRKILQSKEGSKIGVENKEEKREIRNIVIKEFRAVKTPVEEGKEEEKQPIKFEGYAATFNERSSSGWWGDEEILPGAFAESIKDDDIRCLFNHDSNYVLGRNTPKTLELKEDEKGLFFSVTAPDTRWAEDLALSVERGDINQCSFQFSVKEVNWIFGTGEGEPDLRQIKKAKLYDVSIVTFPFYENTSVELKSNDSIKQEKEKIKQEREVKSDEKIIEVKRKKLELMEKM